MNLVDRLVMLRWTAFGAWCMACIPMALAAAVALAALVGLASVRTVSTPFDAFLTTWGLPMSVASVIALVAASRRAPLPAMGLIAAGGASSVVAMARMERMQATATDPSGMSGMMGAGMSGMDAAGAAPLPLVDTLLIVAGIGLLVGGFVWSMRSRRSIRSAA
ncbi:MAG: hypothetical protein ACT4PT_02840 [Methanobacteriota archaeon]